MTAVLGAQRGDKRGPPARGEAVDRVQRGQTGEERVRHPELSADPRCLVSLNVAGEVTRACEKARRILAAWFELGSDVGCLAQEPHLLARAHGDRTGLDGDPHRAVEL